MAVHLTEEQIRDVLTRAEEIHQHGRGGSSDLESVIRAAEEAGLPRQAVEQALQERLGMQAHAPEAGSTVFALSTDGKYYVAEVVGTENGRIRVKFLKGGEHTLPPTDVRPCTLLPGERISCNWKFWGWYGANVVSYDEARQKVKVNDGWGSSGTYKLTDIRLEPPKNRTHGGALKTMLWVYTAGLVSGGAIASWLTWLFLR